MSPKHVRAPCIACKQQPWFGERVRLSCKNGDDIDDDNWRDRSFEITCGTMALWRCMIYPKYIYGLHGGSVGLQSGQKN